MRSLKFDAPKIARQPTVSTPRNAGIVPPAKAGNGGFVPPAKTLPHVGDGFEHPSKGPARRPGSVFEPATPKSPIGTRGSGSLGGKVVFSKDVVDSLKKVGTDLGTTLGANAKRSVVRQQITDAIKNLNLGFTSKRALHQAIRIAYHSYKACVSSASGLRPMPTE